METQVARHLVSVVQRLTGSRHIDEVMKLVRSSARELLNADGVTFVLREGDLCHYADEDAVGPLWKGQKFPIQSCISGWAILNAKPVTIRDVYADQRIPHDAYRPTFVKSLMMVPIGETKPVGAIGSYWAKEHEPSESAIEIARALANAACLALENLSLYAALEKKISELDSANQKKDELLMIMSHELRNPLSAIRGWAQLISSGGMAAERIPHGIFSIERNAKNLNHVIDELLDASQIVLGRMEYTREETDFAALAADVGTRWKQQLSEKRIVYQFSSEEKELWVSGDPERLRQLIGHLLSNAIKFSTMGGSISVTVDRAGPNARLTMKDEGEGMDPRMVESLFEKFRQADMSTTRRHAGLGLGLSIAKNLAEAHDGKITAFSEGIGRGSTFVFAFPYLR